MDQFYIEFETCSAVAGNAKWGSITVPLTSCLTSLDKSVLQIKATIFSCHTADYKPVKQEINGTVILPPLVFPGCSKLTITCTTVKCHLHVISMTSDFAFRVKWKRFQEKWTNSSQTQNFGLSKTVKRVCKCYLRSPLSLKTSIVWPCGKML